MSSTGNDRSDSFVEVPAQGTDAGSAFARFVEIIAALRSEQGCPWDREQTHMSISRNMVEEAYEALDAIERGDLEDMTEELGDVLLEVVLQAQIASDEGEFTIEDVIDGISDKMVRRHPHVFGDEASFEAAGLTDEEIAAIEGVRTPGDVSFLWDYIKKHEKAQKVARRAELAKSRGEVPIPRGILDDVSRSQPALMQAQDISRKLVSHGFEWDSTEMVWEQFEEERREFVEACERLSSAREAKDPEAVVAAERSAELEMGDVLFTLVNVARKHGIDAESALRATCKKVRERWAAVERFAAREGRGVDDYDTEGLNVLWDRAKTELRERDNSC